MGAHDHKKHAERDALVARCAVIVVSDTKTATSDTSGPAAEALLREAGHDVHRTLVPNAGVAAAVEAALREHDLVLTIGGTGPSKKDQSVEAVRPWLEKELPGFGELFRALSAKEIGTAAALSRALLGTTSSGRVACCLPGSEGAVRLGLREILIPELRHLLWELRRYA